MECPVKVHHRGVGEQHVQLTWPDAVVLVDVLGQHDSTVLARAVIRDVPHRGEQIGPKGNRGSSART